MFVVRSACYGCSQMATSTFEALWLARGGVSARLVSGHGPVDSLQVLTSLAASLPETVKLFIIRYTQFTQRCFGENRPLHGGGYGNMTLSRFLVQQCRNYDVSWRHRERRGCLRSDLLLPGGSVLHLFNVHLGTSFIERRHQARQLVSDKVLNLRDCCGPRIVVGDFNEWTRGLASRLMGEAFEALDPRAFARYSRSYPGFFPLLHLDHFYYDRHLLLNSFRIHRGRKKLVASDHLPMVAEFAVKPGR